MKGMDIIFGVLGAAVPDEVPQYGIMLDVMKGIMGQQEIILLVSK